MWIEGSPVVAASGALAGQWAEVTNAASVPTDSTDLLLLAAAVVFLVLTVAVAAMFAHDRPTNRRERPKGERQ